MSADGLVAAYIQRIEADLHRYVDEAIASLVLENADIRTRLYLLENPPAAEVSEVIETLEEVIAESNDEIIDAAEETEEEIAQDSELSDLQKTELIEAVEDTIEPIRLHPLHRRVM